MRIDRLHRSRRVLAVAGGALLAVLAVVDVACGPPPVGWQGAGRNQTLPTPEGDAGGAALSADSGDDSSSGADPVPPTDLDSGDTSDDDGGNADDDSGATSDEDGGIHDAGDAG